MYIHWVGLAETITTKSQKTRVKTMQPGAIMIISITSKSRAIYIYTYIYIYIFIFIFIFINIYIYIYRPSSKMLVYNPF